MHTATSTTSHNPPLQLDTLQRHPATNPRKNNYSSLSEYLMGLLINDMVNYKNATITHRLDFCRTSSSRGLMDCDENSDDFEKQAMQRGDTVIPKKVEDLRAWLRDLLIESFSEVFRLQPTEVPDLSDENKEKAAAAILETVKQVMAKRVATAVATITAEYAQMGISVTPQQAMQLAQERGMKIRPDEQELRDMVLELKGTVTQYEVKLAKKAARKLSRVIKDYIQESDSFQQILLFIDDYARYPFACLRSHHTKKVTRKVWRNNKRVKTREAIPAITRVSPYDVFWSQDSTTTQDGVAFAEHMALRRYEVAELKERQGAIPEQIDKLLAARENNTRDWLITDENPDTQHYAWSQHPGEVISVFRMFTLISGEYLMPYKKQFTPAPKAGKQYQLECYICDGYVLQVKLHDADYERPYYTTSFNLDASTFAPRSLPEDLRVVDMTARKIFSHIIRNTAKSTNPTVLVNTDAIDYDYDDDEPIVQPDTEIPYSQVIGTSARPVDILSIPNYTPQLMSLAQYIAIKADEVIPRFGLSDGTTIPSALRSTGSLKLIVNQTLKTIKVRALDIGTQAIAPVIADLADWILDNHDDPEIQVDAEVYVTGLDGILTKALVTNDLTDALQYLSPFVQSGQVKPEVITGLVEKLMMEMGLEDDVQPEIVDQINQQMPEGMSPLNPPSTSPQAAIPDALQSGEDSLLN